jgi:hypothetical protein
MMRRLNNLIALLIFTAACAHAQPPSAAKRSEVVLLTVISAADNATRIPAAEVFAVGDRGALMRLGATDLNGEITVGRMVLTTEANAVAVVVCHPMFFCGALRAEYIAPRDEATLALAVAVSD